MNGIISEPARRNLLTTPKLASTVVLGVCLFSGFVFGMNVKPEAVSHFHFFKTQKISFEKIAWISPDKLNEIKLKKMNDQPLMADLSFVPFELKKSEIVHQNRNHLHFHPKNSNLAKLSALIKRLNEKKSDVFADFREASSRLKDEFFLAVEVEPANETTVKLVQSSEESPPPAKIIVSALPSASPHVANARSTPEEIMTTQSVSSHLKVRAPQSKVDVPDVSSTQLVSASQGSQNNQFTGLSQSEQKKLTETFLNAQLAATKAQASSSQTLSSTAAGNKKKATSLSLAQNNSSAPGNQIAAPMIARVRAASQINQSAIPVQSNSANCDLGTHLFIKPNAEASPDENSQISPEQNSWVSKSWNCEGWIRAEATDYIPTVTLHPAPNQGTTLLLDQNSLALLAIRSGVRIAKGMGTVLGVLPDNYKVEFIGRSEDTEYFESNGRKYFAILNVEPGAGVLEVQSQKNQDLSSTIFTPVFEDSVTYLDLVAPTPQNLSIQVVKSNLQNDPEVMGLTVGISTQNAIQAITQSSGQAILRGVNLIHGFPVFVDIASKQNSTQGYTYRYELKQRNDQGTFVVNQVTEKTIHHWLKQLKQGLSDQSAMVIGLYDRRHLGGFKENYFSKVEPLSAKFGLEAMNFTILWNGIISQTDPLEGDVPRFMAVQVPEGLSQIKLTNESNQMVQSSLMPISPRVIHVVSE